jgi:hypothetical protein
MKKLKLESLEVTSFVTTTEAARERGTVHGAAKPTPGTGPIQTYSPEACGETQYFDCTLGCSYLTHCLGCTQLTANPDCVIA